MFGRKTEKRVLREADKIISLKEDMDALSWGRVLEIGKQLEGLNDNALAALGRELVSIAQSNLSLYSRLGIDPTPPPSRIMPSGLEVIEGGLAEAALEERKPPISVPSPVEDDAAPETTQDASPSDPLATSDALSSLLEGIMNAPVEDPAEEDFEAAMVHEELKSVADNDPDEGDFSAAEADVADTLDVSDEDAEPEQTLTIADILNSLPPIPAYGASDKPTSPEAEDNDVPAKLEVEEAPTDAPAAEPEETQPEAACVNKTAAPAEESHSEAPSAKEEASPVPEEPRQAEPSKQKRHQFARFRNLYESRDGGLCVFEDENGHLVAIDSSKLA